MNPPIKLGISTCLLGERVRYDGNHKLDRYLRYILGQHVEYVPVCPEVECGFGIPREALRLVGDPKSPRLETWMTKEDRTDRMLEWAQRRVRELEAENLCGFVFKSKSPSSGMERVRVYNAKGVPAGKSAGLFARTFMEHFPLLPVEEEGRLSDLGLRENFLERVFTVKRWQEMVGTSPGALVDFHTRHKMLVLAHSPKHYRVLGSLVAHAKAMPPSELFARYQEILIAALSLKATPAKHANVLYHLLGYFKKQLSADEKQELVELIERYHQGHIPLIVPVTLINHYVRKYDQPYLKEQLYLNPHPIELHLRNHA